MLPVRSKLNNYLRKSDAIEQSRPEMRFCLLSSTLSVIAIGNCCKFPHPMSQVCVKRDVNTKEILYAQCRIAIP